MNIHKFYHDFRNDEFVYKYVFPNKLDGYFVEIGACNGINNSQCYFFEKTLGWDGIAVEPQKKHSTDLIKNRKNACTKCIGDKKCVVNFTESFRSGLSGITQVLKDHEKIEPKKTGWRKENANYDVDMITIFDLFSEYNAPNEIDFLGMDCEGAEYMILDHYFSNNVKYHIRFIALEVGRSDLIDLVLKNNYSEIKNPLLESITFNNKPITWERYFIHNNDLDAINQELVK